jgi:segregation and condensation protein B
MQKDNLEKQIEAILFWYGEPVSIKKLSQILKKNEEEISTALKNIEIKFSDRGIVLVFKEDEVTFGTSKDASEIIDELTKEELIRDLGKAGLETLSIIIFQGPLTRSEIDYIRGVQSTFIIRNLMIRGLIEKIPNPKDQRSFLYKPTFDLLSFMGITKIEEIPGYKEARDEIENYKNIQTQEEQKIKQTELTEDLENQMESTKDEIQQSQENA